MVDGSLCQEVILAIVRDIIETLPSDIYDFYESPPGRKPSDHSKRVSEIISSLGKDDALELVRGVVDMSVFSMLYLMDVEFKEHSIETMFRKEAKGETAMAGNLTEQYRLAVDPGGIIV